MAKTSMISTRIDPDLKAKVENIFTQLGLSTTQAITLFLRQVELQIKKDVKRSNKRNKNFSKFKVVIDYLIRKIELPEEYKDHQLIGNYLGSRECHLEPDWLLIYRIEDEVLILIRLGTHSELLMLRT